MRLFKTLFPLCVFLLLFSCEHEEDYYINNTTIELRSSVDPSDPTVQAIIALGFDISDIENEGRFYIVENDIKFSLNYGQNEGGGTKPTKPTKPGKPTDDVSGPQKHRANDPQINGIFYFFINKASNEIDDGAVFGAVELSAIREAAEDINDIIGSGLTLVEVDELSLADIVVGPMDNCQTAAGLADWGAEPNEIWLNVCDVPEKKAIAIHEFGHIVGFRHTDMNGGAFIPGTCEEDPNSIMNSDIFDSGVNEISVCDVEAFGIVHGVEGYGYYDFPFTHREDGFVLNTFSSEYSPGDVVQISWDPCVWYDEFDPFYDCNDDQLFEEINIALMYKDNIHRLRNYDGWAHYGSLYSPLYSNSIFIITVPNNGTYNWTIPNDIPLTGSGEADFRIKVSLEYSPRYHDFSEYFKISD